MAPPAAAPLAAAAGAPLPAAELAAGESDAESAHGAEAPIPLEDTRLDDDESGSDASDAGCPEVAAVLKEAEEVGAGAEFSDDLFSSDDSNDDTGPDVPDIAPKAALPSLQQCFALLHELCCVLLCCMSFAVHSHWPGPRAWQRRQRPSGGRGCSRPWARTREGTRARPRARTSAGRPRTLEKGGSPWRMAGAERRTRERIVRTLQGMWARPLPCQQSPDEEAYWVPHGVARPW